MGRKKQTGATTAASEEVEEHHAMAASKKNKKKGAAIVADDEYMTLQDDEQDAPSASSTQQRSSANGESSLPDDPVVNLNLSFGELGLSQKQKSKGKNASDGSVGDEDAAVFTGKKKGKKGKKDYQAADEDYDVPLAENAVNIDAKPEGSIGEEETVAMTGKKKGKKGKKEYHAADEDYNVPLAENAVHIDAKPERSIGEEETVAAMTVQKKGKKGKKDYQAADEDYDVPRAENAVNIDAKPEGLIGEEEIVAMMGKKKGKKGKQGFHADEDYYVPPADSTAKIDLDPQGFIPDESVTFTGKKKGKKGKKGFQEEDEHFNPPSVEDAAKVDADLEGSIGDEMVAFTGKKKGKKGKKGFQEEDEDYDFPLTKTAVEFEAEPEESVNEKDIVTFTGKKKGKKGKKELAEDEDYNLSIADGVQSVFSESTKESAATNSEDLVTLQKGDPKKDNNSGNLPKEEANITERSGSGDTGLVLDEEIVAFTGKKKGKKGRKGLHVDDDEYGILGVDDETHLKDTASLQIQDSSLVIAAPLSIKPKKGERKERAHVEEELSVESAETASAVIAHPLDSIETQESTEDQSGVSKKKTKKGKKSGKTAQDQDDLFAILAELEASEEPQLDVSRPDVEEVPYSSHELEDAAMDDLVDFTGAKKKKKKKSGGESKKQVEDINSILAEIEDSNSVTNVMPLESSHITSDQVPTEAPKPIPSDIVEVSSKKKSKKGKKSGRTIQEEEDLDALLAELEGPKVEKPLKTVITVPEKLEAIPQPLVVQESESVQENREVENPEVEESVESAAAKKKKKKKEKEKEKKAANEQTSLKAADEKQELAKNKQPDKKVPKHVREMQERLAKQKELEEKRRQEEEEKRRKEEEEQRRLEELERLKEEAKKRRKEREKEKLLKKKQEGKLLTGKQKEEARRLALMREQLLAQRGLSLDSDITVKEDVVAAPKKPKYDNKKKRRQHQGPSEEPGIEEGIEVSVEVEASMENPEVEKGEEILMQEEEVHAEEDEEMEDWDARSWDDEVSLPAVKSAFAEEEENDKVSKKITKHVGTQPPHDTTVSSVPASPPKSPGVPKPQMQQPNTHIEDKMGQSKYDTDDSEDESESEEEDAEAKRRREATLKREARKAEALAKRSADDLRSPICCILGHVDTGKTKLLDCIRRTNVQEGEAGGITQQIGATYFPMENIKERTKELDPGASLRVPGLLVIDTPGHESFTNLRARGSSLCDIAILVIDIMHGLEPQTIESLNLLKMRHTPFVVALNKVDRLYGWKSCPNAPIQAALGKQSQDVVREFQMRLNHAINLLQEQGLNSEVYYKNKDRRKYVSIVPTSAISGEGVPDLLLLLVELTQKMMKDKLMYISEVECTVLEVKVVEGLGTTIDVILVNGVLHEGDQIVVCGMQGPIVASIRALLTPHPMKELRVKGTYQHHKELKAAQGIKITAQGLEHAIAGTQLHVVGPDDDLEDIKEEAMQDMKNVMSRIDKSGEGVCVQASTLGSLEALLEFLKSPAVQIPVSGINIGPVHKRDVMRASVMLERKRKEYATILAFDVKITQEAKELADELGVKIFMADIIYHLFDQFTAYMNNVKEEKKKESAEEAVFPCVLKILPQCIFNKKDPIIVGVDVLEGVARIGTPLCVPSRDSIDIGRIVSMEVNHKIVDTAKKGQAVAMKIAGSTPEEMQKMYGRHFEHEDELVSHITRKSIDVLKESYRDELSMEEWKLLVKLKKLFNIP